MKVLVDGKQYNENYSVTTTGDGDEKHIKWAIQQISERMTNAILYPIDWSEKLANAVSIPEAK